VNRLIVEPMWGPGLVSEARLNSSYDGVMDSILESCEGGEGIRGCN